MRVRAGVTDVLGVLAFSALPFATVQALADSDFGKKLRVSGIQHILPPVESTAATKVYRRRHVIRGMLMYRMTLKRKSPS